MLVDISRWIPRPFSRDGEERTQALRDGLHGAERALAGANGDQSNGGVDTAQRRNIDGLATDGTGGTNTGGVLTGTAVDDGINGDLDGVGVGGDVDLNEYVRCRVFEI